MRPNGWGMIDRICNMCKELSAIGIKDPEYHIDAFIMKATVCARILDDIEKKTTFIGQEKGKKISLH